MQFSKKNFTCQDVYRSRCKIRLQKFRILRIREIFLEHFLRSFRRDFPKPISPLPPPYTVGNSKICIKMRKKCKMLTFSLISTSFPFNYFFTEPLFLLTPSPILTLPAQLPPIRLWKKGVFATNSDFLNPVPLKFDVSDR